MSNVEYNPKCESLEYLTDLKLSIIQNTEGYRYNSDSILLSKYVVSNLQKANLPVRVLELGTGCGIISLMLAKQIELISEIHAFEIQKSLLALARRNVANNRIEKLILREGNFVELREKEDAQAFDVVVSNPPYRKLGSGKISKNEQSYIARHELKVNLLQLGKSINYFLKPGGIAYLVYPVSRLAELIVVFKELNLYPRVLTFIHHTKDKSSEIFLLEICRNPNASVQVNEPIILA